MGVRDRRTILETGLTRFEWIDKIGMRDVELTGGEVCGEPILLCAFVPLCED